jgi:hypothetical protein
MWKWWWMWMQAPHACRERLWQVVQEEQEEQTRMWM